MLKGGLKTTHTWEKWLLDTSKILMFQWNTEKTPNIHNQFFQNSGKVKKLIAANQTLSQDKF